MPCNYLLSCKPTIILSAIQYKVNIYCLILDLIQHKIPFFYEHLMILITGHKFGIQKWITFGNLLKGNDSTNNVSFYLASSNRIFLSQKHDVTRQHLTGTV